MKTDVCLGQSNQKLKTVMKSKTIVMYGNEDIFGSAIEYLLAAKNDWEIVSVSNKDGWEALNLALKTMPSDVVVIHQESHNQCTDPVLQLLQNHPFIKVVVINLENNMMDVYCKQNLFSKGISGLITVIEN